jgi:hypothetical protein
VIQKNQQLLEYSHKIIKARKLGVELIYVDQTSFNVWNGKKNCWQYGSDKIHFSQTDSKSKNFTLYGGINEITGKFTYEIY